MQFELTKEFLHELSEAIESGNESFIAQHVNPLHEADIAEILDNVDIDEARYIFHLLDQEKASDTLVELEEDVREKFLESFSAKEIAENVIDHMETDEAADVISELPESKKAEVLSHIEDAEHASDIVDLLTYSEDSAGGLMAKELIKVNQNWTTSKAISEMRVQSEYIDNIYTIYVVDDSDHLLGRLSLKRLLFNADSPDTLIKDIFRDSVRSVKADADVEEVVNIMRKYDLVVLPVVNDDHVLLGRITFDDAIDVMEEEADKDYAMASGISEKVESSDKVWVLSRARLPWLLVGIVGGILGAQVLGIFEPQIGEFPEMALFIPLIAAMGGNVGVQSSAIIVQGLANKTMGMESMTKKLGKEFLVALLNGLVCAIIILGYTTATSQPFNLCITVSVALLSVIMFAGLFGTFVPLALNKRKIDPALATGPFITTMNDVFGILLYFWIGYLMYF